MKSYRLIRTFFLFWLGILHLAQAQGIDKDHVKYWKLRHRMRTMFAGLLFAVCVLPLFVAVPACKEPEPEGEIDKELASFFNVYTIKDSSILFKQTDAEKYDTLTVTEPYGFRWLTSQPKKVKEYGVKLEIKFANPDSGYVQMSFPLRCCDEYCSGTQLYFCPGSLISCDDQSGCVITNTNYENFDNENKDCSSYCDYRHIVKSITYKQENSLSFFSKNINGIYVSRFSNRNNFELIFQKNKGLVAYSFVNQSTGERYYYEKL
jgi:hypothetical protein